MLAAAVDDALIGFVFADKYRIVRQIGRGGMGVVYEAEHMQLGKRVAIKLMLEKYVTDTEAVARFQREAVAASRIGNPHIIDVSDVGVAPDGRSFVVMELLNGMPLGNVLELTGPMPPWRAIDIMRQVLRAVGAAHTKGIIHRDLKPDNIFLVEQGDQHDFVKLLDFGISKVVDPDEQIAFTKLTSTGVVMGTPLYMAPEQAMGLSIEPAADIYACGVILYQMLAGRPPFEGQTYAVLVAKLLTQAPEYLGNLRPGLPLALVNAVHRALEKEPHMRFATAEQFAAMLPGDRTPSQLELAGTLDSGVAVPRMTGPRAAASRKRTVLAVGGALLFGVATAGVLIATQTGAGKEPAPAPAASGPTVTPIEKPTPAPVESGTLDVKTLPTGAHVVVDDQDFGATPILATVKPGPHKLKLDLLGYDKFEIDVEVHAKLSTPVFVGLAKEASKQAPIVKTSGPRKPPLDLTALKKDGTPAKTVKPAGDPPGDPPDVAPPKNVRQPPPPTAPAGAKPNPY